MPDGSISYALSGRTCRLAIRGVARFHLGARLDAFVRGLFAEHAVETVEFDLTDAEHLDSTMLGLIARAARYSASRSGRRPLVYSTREDITFLLDTTGFDACADIAPRCPPDCGPMQELPPVVESPRERVARVLKAHRTLMDISDRNVEVFADTVEALKRDLASHPPPSQEPP